jgi:hypothetical protein
VLIGYKRGQTSIVLRLKLLDSAVTTGAGKTGLTSSSSGLLISTIADNESSATVYAQASSNIETITTLGTYATPTASKCRFKEVDATNHKGVYEIQIADARFAVSSAKSLLISVSGVTGVAETDVVIPLTDLNVYDAVRAGLTSLPNAAAEASGGLPTLSAAQASNGTINANVHRWLTGTPNALQSGRVDGYLGATAAAVIASASFAADTGLVPARSNTAQAGASTSITLDASASSTTDFYKGCFIAITGSTGSGQTRLCTAYNGTTKVATVTPAWATNPTSSSTFAVIPGGSMDVQTLNFTTQTARDIGASVLLSSGTGTGQVTLTSGRVNADLTHIAATAWASTTLFTLASHDPGTTLGTSTLTQAQVTGGAYALNSASFSFNSGLDFTTTQKTSIGTAVAASAVASVTGAVGSVTGNVGGNVTGSVGSIGTGGITSSSFGTGAITSTTFAANSITASAMAPDSIGASELAADAVTEIQNGLATAANQTTILARLGAWAGSGRNTILGAFQALFRKDSDATVPSDVNADLGSGAGAANNTTDSLESLRDNLATASALSTAQGNISTILGGVASIYSDTQAILGDTSAIASAVTDISNRLPAALTTNGNMKSDVLNYLNTSDNEYYPLPDGFTYATTFTADGMQAALGMTSPNLNFQLNNITTAINSIPVGSIAADWGAGGILTLQLADIQNYAVNVLPAAIDDLPTAGENAAELFEMTNGVEGNLTLKQLSLIHI